MPAAVNREPAECQLLTSACTRTHQIRHESTGQIVAMAGAELERNQIAQNVRGELTAALGDRSCHIVGIDQRVYVEATGEYFYPDVLVTCLEPQLIDQKPRSLV